MQVGRALPYIEWVPERGTADVYVSVARLASTSDGEYELSFTGARRFAGRADTIQLTTTSSESADSLQRHLLGAIQVGLAAYATEAALARHLRIAFLPVNPPRSRERAASARADTAAPKRWAVTVDLGFTGSSGNSELVALSTGVRVRHVQTRRFRLDWSAAFRYGESKGVVAARHAQSKLDFDLGPSARAAPFISATAQRDPFRRLELRSNFGGGFRYSFYRSQRSEASVRAAALYSHQRFTADVARPPHTDGAWSLRLNGAQRLGKNIRIESAASFEPVIGDSGDYDFESKSKLSTQITPRVALTFSYSYSYDSTPVSKVEHADHRLQSGLSMAF